MSRRAFVRVRVAGKVNFDKLGVVEPAVRWRILENREGRRIRIYGYSAHAATGPWFGYEREDLINAPCTHCGRSGVFGGKLESHWCPGNLGNDSAGDSVPCPSNAKGHDCKGEPSMSWHGAKQWHIAGNHWGYEEWAEIV